MNKHTTARRGKRVCAVLHHGTRFIGQLAERKSRRHVFEERGKVPDAATGSFSIAR